MTKAFIPFLLLGIFLLAGCGNSGKESNNTKDSTQKNTEETSNNDKTKTPEQMLARKWKESAKDMMGDVDTSKYNKFEIKQFEEEYNNSFFEFKADGSYVISRPDEDPNNGKWTLSGDGKTLKMKPSLGDTTEKELVVEQITADKVKFKYKDGALLVLVPATLDK